MRCRLQILAVIGLVFSASGTSADEIGLLGGLPRLRDAEPRRASSTHPDLTRNGDSRPIEPGQTLVLAKLEGPGVIVHFWNTIASLDPFVARSLVLRIHWDGSERPSVEAPLGDFFGVGLPASEDFESAVVRTSSHGRSRECYWPMPFAKQALVTLTNESPDHRVDSFYYYLDWHKLDAMPEDLGYFHARYRQAYPANPGRYLILDAKGRGHFVGVAYSVLAVKHGWIGEGDDFFFVDDEEIPRLAGTGTEDYFGDAWGFRRFAGLQSGVPLFEGYFATDRTSAYRWHLIDPVAFQRSLRFEIEHRGSLFTDRGLERGSFVERPDWISSVAFWYQSPVATWGDPLPSRGDRLPPYRVIDLEKAEVVAKPAIGLVKKPDGVTLLSPSPTARLDIPFTVEEKGTYRLHASIVHSLAGGRCQPMLDGQPIGEELDFHELGNDPIWVDLDLHPLEAGAHVLRFEGKGVSRKRRPMTPGLHALGIRHLIMLRREDLKGWDASAE